MEQQVQNEIEKVNVIMGCVIAAPQEWQLYRHQLCGSYSFLGEELALYEHEYELAEAELKDFYASRVTQELRDADKKLNRVDAEVRASIEYTQKRNVMLIASYGYKLLKNKVQAIEKKLDSIASALRTAEREQLQSKH